MTIELQYNNEIGFLGANLSVVAAGTSQAITNLFQTAPNFATLTAGQYIKLALDAGVSNFEIVYLTAYTAGSRNGTITRGAEDAGWPSGTPYWPPAAHSSGSSTWQVVPTVADFTALNTAITAANTAITNETSRATTAEGTKLAILNNLADLNNKVTALINLIGGTPTTGQLLEYNGSAWVPFTLASLPPSGSATGDLSGTYPAPAVARIQGTGVSNTPPTAGQVLQYSGTQWVPTSLLPTGTMVIWTGSVASTPAGWVAANGALYSTTGATAALFALYGYTFGGSGTQFGVPDLRGRIPVGYIDANQFGYNNHTPGQTYGAAQIATNNLPDLTHAHAWSGPVTYTPPAVQAVVQVSASSLYLPTAGAQPVSLSTQLNVGGATDNRLTGFTNNVFALPSFAVVPIIKL